jgi:hypothetical protein
LFKNSIWTFSAEDQRSKAKHIDLTDSGLSIPKNEKVWVFQISTKEKPSFAKASEGESGE